MNKTRPLLSVSKVKGRQMIQMKFKLAITVSIIYHSLSNPPQTKYIHDASLLSCVEALGSGKRVTGDAPGNQNGGPYCESDHAHLCHYDNNNPESISCKKHVFYWSYSHWYVKIITSWCLEEVNFYIVVWWETDILLKSKHQCERYSSNLISRCFHVVILLCDKVIKFWSENHFFFLRNNTHNTWMSDSCLKLHGKMMWFNINNTYIIGVLNIFW